jgi:hypothetical protein
MRGARLSTAARGSMIALAASALSAGYLSGQTPTAQLAHGGAMLVQTTDTAINPVAADIVLPAFGLRVRLSEEGTVLLLSIPDGLYLVQARHLGHRPEWRVVRITGDTVHVDFVLAPADPENGSVGAGLADARLRDFLRRAGVIQFGSFITRGDIERHRPRNLAALLKRVPHVTIDRAGPGPTVVRSVRAPGSACPSGMLLFVDGMLPNPPRTVGVGESAAERRSLRGRLTDRSMLDGANVPEGSRWSTGAAPRHPGDAEWGAGGGGGRTRRTASALDWVPISLVAGVEVYPSAVDVPVEFRVAGAECGAVLIWTVRR